MTLTAEQHASFQALRHEFEAKLNDARKRVAAHELAKWRLDAIQRDWCDRVDSLLSAEQKQVRLIHILREPTQIEFVETPLIDVIGYLKDLHCPLPLRLDRAALRRANKDADIPLTRNLRSITLDSALRLTLGQVGLMHVLQGDTILITTEEDGHQLLQHGAVDPATLPSPPRDAAAKKLAEALRKPVAAENFVNVPVKDFVDHLKDACHVEIQIDDRALEVAGISPDVPRTIDLKAGSLENALKQILDRVGLKHVIQDEVILITAAPPADPRPAKPPVDAPGPAALHPPPDERVILDRLEDLGASCRLDEDWVGRVISILLDSVAKGDEALRLAGQLPELKSLDLSEYEPSQPGTTDRGLAHLRHAARLTHLRLHGEKITDAGIANLAGLTHLQQLSLAETDITDAALKHLEHLAYLKEFSLAGTRVDGSGLAALPTMNYLETLDLDDTQVADACLAHLARFPHLKVLDLSRSRIDGSGLGSFARLHELERLSLASTWLTDAGLRNLTAASLESLDLQDTAITDAGLPQLAALGKLESLNLRNARITDAGLEHIAKLTNLTELDLSGTQITDAGLRHLLALKKLEFLSLNETLVSDAGLGSLREIPALVLVFARQTRVSRESLAKLNNDLTKRLAEAKKKR